MRNAHVKLGPFADLFYDPRPTQLDMFNRMGVLAIEMEAAGLYGVAAEHGAAGRRGCGPPP